MNISCVTELTPAVSFCEAKRNKAAGVKFVPRFAQDSMDDSEQSEESRTYNLLTLSVFVSYVLI